MQIYTKFSKHDRISLTLHWWQIYCNWFSVYLSRIQYIQIQQSALWHLSKQVTKEETMPVPGNGNDWCNTKYETEQVMPGMKYSENPMRTLTNERTSKYLQFTLERINLNYAGKGILILIWIHHTIFTTVVFCKMLCVGERPSIFRWLIDGEDFVYAFTNLNMFAFKFQIKLD